MAATCSLSGWLDQPAASTQRAGNHRFAFLSQWVDRVRLKQGEGVDILSVQVHSDQSTFFQPVPRPEAIGKHSKVANYHGTTKEE